MTSVRRGFETEDSKWAKIIYQTQIDQIRFSKETRWKLVYYVILLFVGLYVIKKDKFIEAFWIILFAISIALCALYFIFKIQKDICLCRKIIEGTKKDVRDIKNKVDNIIERFKCNHFLNLIEDKDFIDDINYAYILSITIIIGTIILIFGDN